MSSVKVFVKEGCIRCPAAKDVAGKLANEGYDVHEYRLETADGLAESVFYGVMSTPTLMVVDESEEPVACWRGNIPAVEDVKSALSAA